MNTDIYYTSMLYRSHLYCTDRSVNEYENVSPETEVPKKYYFISKIDELAALEYGR